MDQQISVIAIAEARSGYGPWVERAILPCIAETRRGVGCLLYTVHRDKASPERFAFIEKWASEGALESHTSTAHFKAMESAMTPFLERPLSIMVLETLEAEKLTL